MLSVAIAAIGRLKSGPESQLAEMYLERAAKLGRNHAICTGPVTDFAESQAATAPLRRAQEKDRLAAACPPGATIICLDEKGRSLTSSAFAQKLAGLRDQGTSDVVFLIGGPDGLAPELTGRARFCLAFGAMTWPHRLCRIMLAEQLYRAVTIMARHPYHRA